jgi:hypothetical protein
MLEPIRLGHCLEGRPPRGPNLFCWQNGRLTYMLADYSQDIHDWDKVMTPTSAQWEEFWRVCDEINVWSWPPTLGELRVFDGLSWTTELEVGSRHVVSRGQLFGSPPDFRAELMRLHGALQAMVGWQTPIDDRRSPNSFSGFLPPSRGPRGGPTLFFRPLNGDLALPSLTFRSGIR